MSYKIVLGSALALSLAASSFGASFKNVNGGVWNSGVDSANPNIVLISDGQVDPHYVLLPPTGSGFNSNSFVVMTGSNSPVGTVWASGNGSESKWVGPTADQSNTSGIFASASAPFVYRMFFNLSVAGVLANANTQIQLQWLSDNMASSTSLSPTPTPSEIRMCAVASASDTTTVCNTAIPNSGNAGGETPSQTALTGPITINSGFTNGWMALDFYVFNSPIISGQNPTGLRVEILSATGDSAVPEPGTLVLLSAGLAGLAMASRRKQ